MNAGPLAAFAFLPAMIGPPAEQAPQTIMRLCSGGSIVLPLDRSEQGEEPPCTAKACHAASCRKPLPRAGQGDEDE